MRSDARDTHKALAAAIRARRAALGLTQEQAGAIAGCGRLFVSQAEGGKPTLRLDKLLDLLDALGLKLALESGQGRLEARSDAGD